MNFMGGDKNQEKIEDEIKILATNVEVLNQRLLNDSGLGGSVGEGGISSQQYMEINDKFKEIFKTLDVKDANLKEFLNFELEYIKKILNETTIIAEDFPRQKDDLKIVIDRLNNVIETFNAADKDSMISLASTMNDFNKNVGSINEQIEFFQKKVIENVNYKVNEIGDVVANRLARTNMISMGIFALIACAFIILTMVLK